VSRPMMASFAWLRRGELPLSTRSRQTRRLEAVIQIDLDGEASKRRHGSDPVRPSDH